MTDQHLFATFLLNNGSTIEIAIDASVVIEAIPMPERFYPVPTSVDFLEGIMELRGNIIPVINLKNRFGFDDLSYGPDAKITIIESHGKLYGILVDNIRDVISVDLADMSSIKQAFQTKDQIIKGIIRLDNGKRLIQFVDVDFLFTAEGLGIEEQAESAAITEGSAEEKVKFGRYLIFLCDNQEYGLPIDQAQAITPPAELDTTFQSGYVAGAVKWRGATLPIITTQLLLTGQSTDFEFQEESRVIVLHYQDHSIGFPVDQIVEIATIAEKDILSMPASTQKGFIGVFQTSDNKDTILLDIHSMIRDRGVDVQGIACLGATADKSDDHGEHTTSTSSQHLITEHSYLVFQVEINFAIELINVQEILNDFKTLPVSGRDDMQEGVINLRGTIVPVINMRKFYEYPDAPPDTEEKLIVVRGEKHSIALHVDDIITILKQNKHYDTPSLNPQLAKRQDTLSRTIETQNESGIMETILVLDIENLITNHLHLAPPMEHGNGEEYQEAQV